MGEVKRLCCVLFILIMLSMTWYGRVSGDAAKKDTTYVTQQGIRSVKEITGIFATKAADAVKALTKGQTLSKLMKVASFIGKAAPFLGVAGFLIPMIMGLLGGESGQMKLLKAEFFKVNEKLDKITNKLDKIDSKITFENQRAAYIEPQETIKFSYGKMQAMINETGAVKCDAKKAKECKRKKIQIAEGFLEHFKTTEAAMHTIFQTGKGSVFKEPLMKMMRENYDCDIPKLTDTFKKLTGLSKNAQMVVNMKEKLSGSEKSIVQSTDTYMKMMYKFRESFYTQINECRRQMLETNKVKNLFVKDIKAKEEKSVLEIKNTLEGKYPWLKWVSLLTFKRMNYYGNEGIGTSFFLKTIRIGKEKANTHILMKNVL